MLRDFFITVFSKIIRKKRRFDNKTKFKLFMTLVVKNEEDIIEQNIRFHKEMGVDGFIVSTHNSTENTNAILLKLIDEGFIVDIIYRTTASHQHSYWVNEMVEIAKKKYKADWIINADADEFYYSNRLNLKQSIIESEGANLIWVDSFFLFPEEREDFLNSTYFVTRPFQKFEAESLRLQKNPLFTDYIGSQGCTKVLHRTRGFKTVFDGNHDAKMRFQV